MRRLNPCELEIDLFCRGIRIPPNVTSAAKLARRTRAGLGSGLELVILGGPKEVWANAPVMEPFAQKSPYQLEYDGAAFAVRNEESGMTYPVRIPAEPAWYERKTSSGRLMSHVGVLQGTYLGVYIGPVCRYWKAETPENCAFCTTGLNEETDESWKKSVSDVLETCAVARRESGITFVHFNSGYQEGRDLQIARPFISAVKEKTGLMVGVQLAPVEDLSGYDALIQCGADHFSFCLEFMSRDAFDRFCPGKSRTLGQEAFFRAMEYTASRLGKGRVSGEIIAGIEPIEDTFRAIDRITDCGAFPTICVFRPLVGSRMEDVPPPRYEDMVEVFRYMIDRLIAKRIPIGIAPNIEVSLVVQPTDALYLAKRDFKYLGYSFFNGLAARVARPVFGYRLRAGDRRMPA